MLRVAMLCVLCVSIATGVASGSAGVEPNLTAKQRLAKSHGRFLFGHAVIGARVAHAPPGRATAFAFRSSRAATVTAINLYVDVHNRAKLLIAGLYANRAGHPGRALASNELRSPKRGRWNTVTVRAAAVEPGRTYWLAVLGRGGPLYFRERGRGHCASQHSRQRRLASLPAVWRTGSHNDACRVSAYLGGHFGKDAWRPVAKTSPPPAGSTPPGGSAPPGSGGGGSPAPPVRNCAGSGGIVSQAALDACGLPSMNSTGPPAGTPLTDSSSFTASTPGAVYNALNVSGSIYITANNVTIQNSNITDVDPDNAAIQIANGVTGTQIRYTSIHGTNTGQSGALAFAVSYYGSTLDGVTMDHDNFYNGDRILTGYGTITNSYCLGGANFSGSGGVEHDECVYTGGGAPGIRAIHDTLLVDNAQTAAIFVDNPDYGGGGVDGTLDVESSILAGGGYCIYGGDGASSPHTGSVIIKNNRFSRIFYSNCGQFGTDAHFTSAVTTWSGNVWDETNKPVG